MGNRDCFDDDRVRRRKATSAREVRRVGEASRKMTDPRRSPSRERRHAVILSHYVDAPDSWAFCARLGAYGWYDGWGRDVDEALDELTRVLAGEPRPELPDRLGRDRDSIRQWLEERVDMPILEGDCLVSYIEEEAPSRQPGVA